MPPASGKPVALLLGAALHRDGSPSAAMLRRTAHAAMLWHAGSVGRIVATGGAVRHPVPEAAVMHRLLREAGVPDRAIVLETASRNTAQNIALSAPLLPPGAAVVIVTDRFHAPRARLIARAHGLPATTASPGRSTGSRLRLALDWLREGAAIVKWLALRRRSSGRDIDTNRPGR
ncbi:MAG: YdcF family protein [Gemmobacter sp.]